MAVTAARRVRTLRLLAPAEELVTRGRVLVEDALRCASFPETPDRRLLLIRHLELGLIDPRRSSMALTRVIAERVRLAGALAVRFDHPAATDAEAVYFPDGPAAPVALAFRLATRGRAPAWYWPMAVPGWMPEATPAEGIRIAITRLLALSGGNSRLVELVHALHEHGCLPPLLDGLSRDDGFALLRVLGHPLPRSLNGDARQVVRGQTWPTRLATWKPAIREWGARWGRQDPRSIWLATMALLSHAPHLISSPDLVVKAFRLAASAHEPVVAEAIHELTLAPEPAVISAEPSIIPLLKPPRKGKRTVTEPVDAASPAPRLEKAPIEDTPVQSESDAPPEPVSAELPTEEAEWSEPELALWELDCLFTDGGGLFYLVGLLSRLGIGERIAADPVLIEADFGHRILHYVARRLGVPPADPVFRLLRDVPDLGNRPDLEPYLRAWYSGLRRLCYRSTRLRLGALVLRTALVSGTLTHIDVIMGLREVDIRVRRAGLDVDPGWVPWLGRIVSFHYRESDS